MRSAMKISISTWMKSSTHTSSIESAKISPDSLLVCASYEQDSKVSCDWFDSFANNGYFARDRHLPLRLISRHWANCWKMDFSAQSAARTMSPA